MADREPPRAALLLPLPLLGGLGTWLVLGASTAIAVEGRAALAALSGLLLAVAGARPGRGAGRWIALVLVVTSGAATLASHPHCSCSTPGTLNFNLLVIGCALGLPLLPLPLAVHRHLAQAAALRPGSLARGCHLRAAWLIALAGLGVLAAAVQARHGGAGGLAAVAAGFAALTLVLDLLALSRCARRAHQVVPLGAAGPPWAIDEPVGGALDLGVGDQRWRQPRPAPDPCGPRDALLLALLLAAARLALAAP